MASSETHTLPFGPPVAARETARVYARVRRASRRRKLTQALILAFSFLLLGVGGFAYYQHTRLAPLDPTHAELSVATD